MFTRPCTGCRIWLRRSCVVAAIVAVAFVLLESGLRIALRVRGESYSPQATRQELAETVELMLSTLPEDAVGDSSVLQGKDPSRRPIPSPFTGWTTESDLAQLSADLPALTADPGTELRVLIVGESVAAKFARDGQARLEEGLREVAGLEDARVVFFNHGRGAYKQPQQAMHLQFLFSLGCKPDLVINIDGFNEIAASMVNGGFGIHPGYPAANFWSYLVGGADARSRSSSIEPLIAIHEAETSADSLQNTVLRFGLHRSALTGLLARSRLRRIHRAWTTAMSQYTQAAVDSGNHAAVTGPKFTGTTDEALRIACEVWAQSSLSMKGMCDAHGVAYLHVLQPTLTDPESKPLSPEELEILKGAVGPQTTFVDLGYPLLRAAGKELLERGVRFLDASQVFAIVERRIYRDVCHYNPHGNRLLADFMVQPVAQALQDRRR